MFLAFSLPLCYPLALVDLSEQVASLRSSVLTCPHIECSISLKSN
jgi:hypothetical protein